MVRLDGMRALGVAFAVVMTAALAAPDARAWERGQGFGVDTGVSMLSVNNEAVETGISFGLHYSLRITDQFDFVGEAGCSVVDLDPIVTPTSPTDRPAYVWNGDAGLIYKMDIVRFVPYFGGLVGGYALTGGSLPSSELLPGVELAVGGDYLLTRRWAVGVAARYTLLFTDLSTYPTFLTVTARVELNWGGM